MQDDRQSKTCTPSREARGVGIHPCPSPRPETKPPGAGSNRRVVIERRDMAKTFDTRLLRRPGSTETWRSWAVRKSKPS
jgi:hypothetical protein